MSDNLYSKQNAKNLKQLKELAPEQLNAFGTFDKATFEDGTLAKKEKEIIAVSIAHVTQCPYCIDAHTKSAKKEGVSLEELAEAVFVVTGVQAGGAVTHSTHMQNALDSEADDALYERSNLKHMGHLKNTAHDAFQAYGQFDTAVTKDGKLSTKFKEIIAVAVAHATFCPYCIDIHTKNADQAGATKEELSEAVMVTASLLAGGAYAHMANMIDSYNEG